MPRNRAVSSAASTSGTRATATPLGKGRQQPRRQGAIEDDKDAAIVGAADQPAIGLPQPQPGDLVGILGAAEDRLAGAVQDVRARPRHAVEDQKAQRAARDVDAVADRVGAEQARILLGAEDVDKCRGRHRLDMLGQQQQAARFEHRGDALVHRPQPGDRGEQSERPAARRREQCRIGRGDLADVVARDVGDDKDAGLRRIIEGRGDTCRGRAGRQMAQTGRGLGAAPGEVGVGVAIGQVSPR